MGIFIGGAQVATIIGAYTGDWGVGVARTAEITANITGVQTVDVMFMVESDEMSSGTPFSISFTEKAPAPTEPAPEPEPAPAEGPVREDVPAVVETRPEAPRTGDNAPLLICVIFAAGIAAVEAARKKAKNI